MSHRVKHKKCRTCSKLRPIYRFHKNSRAKDGLRSECWSCAADRKREWRSSKPGRKREPRDSIYHTRIPSERVLPIFKDYMARHPGITNNTNGSMVRAVHRIENEITEVRFDFLDRWLVELGLSHLWHVPPERGGLSDFYEIDLCPSRSLRAQPPVPTEPRRASGAGSFSSQSGDVHPPVRRRTPPRKVAA